MPAKLNVRSIYLGNQSGGVITMPFDVDEKVQNSQYLLGSYGLKSMDEIPQIYEALNEYLKSPDVKKFKYVFAVTANKYQKKSAEVLKNNGFRPIENREFLSSHGNLTETLTIWIKTQEDYLKDFDFSQTQITDCGLNCSVGTNRIYTGNLRCTLTAQKENETLADLKKLNFERIKNTPIWFFIDKKHLVVKEKA